MSHRNFRFNMSKTENITILTKLIPHHRFPLIGSMSSPTYLPKLEIQKSSQTFISVCLPLPDLPLESLRSVSLHLHCHCIRQVLVFIFNLEQGLASYSLQTKSILPFFFESPVFESSNRTQPGCLFTFCLFLLLHHSGRVEQL